MAQIKDTNVVKTSKVVVDPRLNVPGDVVDIYVANPDGLPDDPNDAHFVAGSDIVIVDFGGGSGSGSSILGVPVILDIASQTVRITTDGHSVVDVLIDITDVTGATSYEVEVTTDTGVIV